MKKYLICSILCFFSTILIAQKKVVPISVSALTDIALPVESKTDSRVLSISGANMLLEMESKKFAVTLNKTEVLILAPASSSGFNYDSLHKKLTGKGWELIPIQGDIKYTWLKKGNRYIIMYFSMDAKMTNLYLAEASSFPDMSGKGNQMPANLQTGNEAGQPLNPKSQPIKQNLGNNQQNTKWSPSNSGYSFTTTNFDDGCTSTVLEDWVEVNKGNVKVLIHYPNKKADAYNSVQAEGLKNAWNILVAPKYNQISNFVLRPIYGWQSIDFAEADAVENITGKNVHIVLFKYNYSNGSGKYMEFITSDKATYEQELGAYHETSYGWEKVASMANYNKFAVAASDLYGKWTNDYSGMLQYVNAYTGADAFATSHASNESFEIRPGNTYNWTLVVASGIVGNIKFQTVKSNGNISLPDNWQISFSDIEGKPRTYNAFFSCVKGARILWLDDRAFGRIE